MIGVVLSQMTVTMGGHTFTSENGFRTGLMVGCGVALVAAVIAAAIPAMRRTGTAPTPRRNRPRPRSDPRLAHCSAARSPRTRATGGGGSGNVAPFGRRQPPEP